LYPDNFIFTDTGTL